MSITKKEFGNFEGQTIYEYTISNKNLTMSVLNYGGIIRTLIYNGVDVVLGRDSLEEYLQNSGCFGVIVGRNSNRLENSEFILNGKLYKLNPNNGRNNLHGGIKGWDKKVWNVEEKGENALVLYLTSPDGDEGFPGEVKVNVTYTLTDDDALSITYEGVSDSDTILNMTNHSYFNLNGHNSGSAENHTLLLNCPFYTPNNEECMPTGEIHSVKGTPFDFTSPDRIGKAFTDDFIQSRMFNGLDHNFVIEGRGMRLAASFCGDKTGIKMDTYTDCPGVQIYSNNKSDPSRTCKDGAHYVNHSGICFETQAFPNAMKHTHFPSTVLRKEEQYYTQTIFKFSNGL